MGDSQKVAAEALAAFNAHDERRIRETYAENPVVEAPGGVRLEGLEAAMEFSMAWLRAFPDVRLTARNELEAGDWVVQEFTFEGTHEDTLVGPAGEIPATHRRVVGRGVQIVRVSGGKIAEERLYFDQVELLSQLGLMPEPATA